LADSEKVNQSNTLSTPQGGQYNFTLPDGTRVWLNAASSIQFPSSFGQRERLVSITGEVYFEVAHQNRPFKVQSQQQVIEVLGTHFNVMAYPEKHTTQTTLLKGAVKIHYKNQGYLLKPG